MSEVHDDLDPDFEDFLSDVRGAFEAPRAAADFDEVVARAHRAAPEVVGAAVVMEAASLAKVVPLGRRDAGPPPDPELDAFVADVRAVGEAAVTERRLAGIPSFRSPQPARRWGRWLAGAAAAAAAVLLAYGAGSSTAVRRSEGATSAAVMSRALEASRGAIGRAEAIEAERAAIARAEAERAAAEGAAVSDAAPEEAALEVEPSAPAAPGASGASEVAGSKSRRSPQRRSHAPQEPATGPTEDPLSALDAAAQQRWRSGDLAGAEALFREIIRRDGGGRWTQLAYGDLFVLARQRGDGAAELSLWQEYLARHPRGPHADDASAGVCRRAAADEAVACWERYLESMPRGAYRGQAERVVAAAGGDEEGGR